MNAQALSKERLRCAVIYCRVSSAKQTTRGDGLGSQETRCREYARYKGYAVKEIFKDDVSGSLTTRPGMQAMLRYLRKHRGEGPVVIIDDISRLARGLEAHLKLRADISGAGGTLESPSIEFGEDSDSLLVENLLASVSQHQRQKNGEQTLNRMRARAMNGYWCFHAPIGFKFERTGHHGKLLVRDEPCASLLQEALEGFACGRFETQAEVKRFLENQPEFPKVLPGGEIRNQRIYEFLTRVLYAGYVEVPNWNISARKGHHEGLISFETFEKIQFRLKAGAKAPARKDISQDFPLRGFVLCNDCGNPLTANWSKSKTGKKYPYYMCFSRGCVSYRKSIRREKLEGEFEGLLRSMQPSKNLLALSRTMFAHAWEQRAAQAGSIAKDLEQRLSKLDKQIEQLVSRIVEASTPSVISAYEQRIAKLENEKIKVSDRLSRAHQPQHTFEEMFELAFRFLSKPWKLWSSNSLELKRVVLRLAFAERLRFDRREGLRTPETAMPFKALAGSMAPTNPAIWAPT